MLTSRPYVSKASWEVFNQHLCPWLKLTHISMFAHSVYKPIRVHHLTYSMNRRRGAATLSADLTLQTQHIAELPQWETFELHLVVSPHWLDRILIKAIWQQHTKYAINILKYSTAACGGDLLESRSTPDWQLCLCGSEKTSLLTFITADTHPHTHRHGHIQLQCKQECSE